MTLSKEQLEELKQAGFVVVPIEPTEEVCRILPAHHVDFDTKDGRFIYKAMIQAAREGN